ncbi:dnaJ homolog subfamily C member 3b [Poecilia latipinna]|uniref:DnaJ homolog subfamily C member 3 n=3 Tax=Poecilia TaxID=8080 RepID=A0A087Y426_POEFO|nr:PREDICTED: dnaJ homolog subfamily C member 3-like [Poecilia formosa]XP_014852944.1 PREDICTED: dnaJ homolog subfamily C member 3-like [Poecilia mexicana]XP_014899670.1 PREDICTED: dnaJ homolog subfamily C member 3-like [Poecilia latipinna]
MEWCWRTGGASGLLCSLSLLCVLLDIQLDGVLGATHAEIEHHLEMGRKLLAAGQLAEALSHYHSAVEGDSENYLTYYKRAAVFLAMGRSKSALPDLTRAIQLKPDFLPARLQRGNILLKQGNTQEAREDFRMVLQRSGDHKEAQEQLMKARDLEVFQEEAQTAYHQGDYSGTINALERVIEISPWDPESRELRADCYLRMGDPQKAIQDLTPAARLRNDNRAAFLKLSRLLYNLGEHHDSLNHIRECLKLDQDDKECFSHYKQVKKLSKQLDSAEELIQGERFQEAIEKFESVMKTEPNVEFYTNLAKERICFCLVKLQLATEAIDVCSEAHQRDPRNANILKDRAEAYILNQDYEKAVEDYQEAREFDGDSNTIKEGLDRAQKLLKLSRKRDYYKILGVGRNANKQEIIKAYRKLAQQWHPDNFQSEADKKEAEKKFIDIASAKEVLTDPEMRQKFDEGEDPLDPETQQGGGGGGQRAWPFHFNPFESGGNFHFKFEYN